MSARLKQNHALFMTRALRLALGGRQTASPNPVVGACVVKNGKIISEDCHQHFGGPHAEAMALKRLGRKAKGATLYVTLEPCSTWGKTPPCTDLIIQHGIRQVVIGCKDPNPLHHGKGIRLLKQKGIRVRTGVLRQEAVKQNEAFFKWIKTQMPFVILKMAQSLDGKIATKTGQARWISGKQARLWVHALRASVDSILVGKKTVLKDNPRLTARLAKGRQGNAWRLVLDTKAALPTRMRLFHQRGISVLVCGDRYLRQAAEKHKRSHINVMPVKMVNGKVDLKSLLKKLGRLGITSLLVEGGGEVASNFLKAGLVDKVCFIVAPKIIGGRQAPTSVTGKGIQSLKQAQIISGLQVSPLGEDLLIEGYC